MAFAELWLPIFGAGVCIAWAIAAWYGGSKLLSIWLSFTGIVCLLLLGTLQIQHAIERGAEIKPPVGPSEAEMSRSRAFVGVRPLLGPELKIGQVPIFRLMIKNSGQTPAYDVAHMTTVSVRKFPPEEEFEASVPDETSTVFNLNPGDEMQIVRLPPRVPINQVDLERLTEGTYRYYIWGQVRYKDAFGKGHTTDFRFMYGGKSLSISELEYHPSGNKSD